MMGKKILILMKIKNQSINIQSYITKTSTVDKIVQQNKKEWSRSWLFKVFDSSSSTTASTTSLTAKIKKTNENEEEISDEEYNEESILEQRYQEPKNDEKRPKKL